MLDMGYWRARSVSRSLTEQLAGRDVTLRVLSAHPQACNLVSDYGDLVALVTSAVGNGPFHVVLAEPALTLDRLRPGDPARYHQGQLQVADVSIDLQHAPFWEPKVAWPDAPMMGTVMADLAEYVSTRARSPWFATWKTNSAGPAFPGRWPEVLAERASQAAGNLVAGLAAGDVEWITWEVGGLTGLGPGLTPAGDDFLVGLMAGLWAWPIILPSGWTADRACQLIVQVAAHRTTLLSAAWLRHAAAGEFAEPWHDLVQALANANEADIHRAADRILDAGATSGADAMAGFLAPFLARHPRQRPGYEHFSDRL